jgi:tRNA-dihydrouridine synthase B
VQLFGSDVDCMAQAAEKVMNLVHPDFIDLNMGCPVPKVANNGDGSALMKDPHKAMKIVEAVRHAASCPVTVKTRKGWDKGSVNAVEFAQAMESAGAAAVAIHARTKTQMYAGRADWDIIREVKQALSVPVVANGDVFEPEDVPHILRYTGADAVMIGRGAFGNPWLFQRGLAASGARRFRPCPLCGSGWRWPWSRLSWPRPRRGRKSPAWRPGNSTPGTCGGCPTAATGSSKSVTSP